MNIEPSLILFLTALSIGLLSGYITRITARGTGGRPELHNQHSIRLFLGALATAALIGNIVWGLAYLPWWITPLAFLAISLFIVPRVIGTRMERYGLLYRGQAALDGIQILLVLYLWGSKLRLL